MGAGLLTATLAGCGSTAPAASGAPASGVTPAPTSGSSAQPQTAATDEAQSGFIAGLHTVTTIASTIPSNLDVNPYAILVAPVTTAKVDKGDVLADNFNASGNFQGTGTTIVRITPGGGLSTYAQIPANQPGCPGGVGLTTAMTMLSTGWLIVGSAPTTDGTTTTAGAGCLLVLDPRGQVADTIQGTNIDGPWDLAAVDNGTSATLYITNTLQGIGAVGQPGRRPNPRTVFIRIFNQLATADALNQFTTHTGCVLVAVPPAPPGPGHWIGESLFAA